MVEPRGIASRDQRLLLVRHTLENALDNGAGAWKRGLCMRVVRPPEQGLDANQAAQLNAHRILLKTQKAVLAEEITGDGIPLEPSSMHTNGLLRVQIVHTCEKIGHPCYFELDGSHLEPGIALKDSCKDHGS